MPKSKPKVLASVLRRVPGNPEWVTVDFPLTRGAFNTRTLQTMVAGQGECVFGVIRLGDDYALVRDGDGDGQAKALAICLGLRMPGNFTLPLLGPVAVVRALETRKHGGSTDFVGLKEGDREFVLSRFPWVTM